MASSLSLIFNTMFSLMFSWRSIRCNLLLRCICWDPINCGFMIRLSMNIILVFFVLFYAWFIYLCISLWSIDLVWPTRLIFLALGEVLCDGFNLVVLNPSDRRRHDTHCVLLPLRIKICGLFILIGSIPLHHVILLKALLRSC